MNSLLRFPLVVLLLTFPCSSYGETSAEANIDGYMHCDLHNLVACQNTNQIFSGLRDRKSKHRYAKTAFPKAISHFLNGAPKYHTGKYSFSASQVAQESLWGPGERYQFPSGELLFDGFTPHDAPDCAAVIFDSKGKILLIAILNRDDSNSRDSLYRHVLRIYTHDEKPKPEFVQHLQNWARGVVDNLSGYPGLPKDTFGGTQYIVRTTGARWTKEQEP